MKINKQNTIKTLSYYADNVDYEINLQPLMNCGNFEENILLNEENDKWEKYEIFLACLMHIHQDALQQDEFEISELLMKAYYNQCSILQCDVDGGEDQETIEWKYFCDEYFNQQIQLQLNNYSKK